jgi:RNA recognition motif-containing protein
MKNKRDPNLRVFVGNLDCHVTVSDVRKMLERFGKVDDVYFPNHTGAKIPKLFKRRRKKDEPINFGCAFVQFKTEDSVKKLLAFDGSITDTYGRLVFFAKANPA